jgi:hypothetical protein
MGLLKIAKKSLVWFLTSLLFVVLSATAFAKQPQTFTIGLESNKFEFASLQATDNSAINSSYNEFVASHLEPNFYQ